MDAPVMLIPLANALTPVLILLAIGLPIVGIYIANRFFALRTKELELESQHSSRELVARVSALELRQGAVEKAVVSLSGVRADLLEAPPQSERDLQAAAASRLRER